MKKPNFIIFVNALLLTVALSPHYFCPTVSLVYAFFSINWDRLTINRPFFESLIHCLYSIWIYPPKINYNSKDSKSFFWLVALVMVLLTTIVFVCVVLGVVLLTASVCVLNFCCFFGVGVWSTSFPFQSNPIFVNLSICFNVNSESRPFV